MKSIQAGHTLCAMVAMVLVGYACANDDARPFGTTDAASAAAVHHTINAGGGAGNPACPGLGSCLQVGFSPGCVNAQCCNDVCAFDSSCCNNEWDAICAIQAQSVSSCVPGTCGSGAGSCFTANGTPGCEDRECCAIVCEFDPFCCNFSWDSVCVGRTMEAQLCGGVIGACCLNDQCVDTTFSSIDCELAGGVFLGFGNNCSEPDISCDFAQCPGPDSCFTANTTLGCNDETCCELVCTVEPFCCTQVWDELCRAVSTNFCDIPAPCFSASNPCDTVSPAPGCTDLACCAAVCEIDSFCCNFSWDEICIANAVPICPEVIGGACCLPNDVCFIRTPAICASLGGFYAGNDTACDSTACIGACCLPDESCTEVSEVECTEAGGVYQGQNVPCKDADCPFAACPGTGPCLGANVTVGCENEVCCNAVCNVDAFCCEFEWDALCSDRARGLPLCLPAFPACDESSGGCLMANGTPGCGDIDCCSIVCDVSPFCCDVAWDQYCADTAAMTTACSGTAGACCVPNGSCVWGEGVDCVSYGGVPLGAGVACSTALCTPCPWDCSPQPFGNGLVNIDDLFGVINDFGTSGPCDNSPDNGDGTFGNGTVNIDDLFGVINNFGPCP